MQRIATVTYNKNKAETENKIIYGSEFFYDGCHKFYIIESEKDKLEMFDKGWSEDDIYPIESLPGLFESSCGLEFINNVSLDREYVPQLSENVHIKLERPNYSYRQELTNYRASLSINQLKTILNVESLHLPEHVEINKIELVFDNIYKDRNMTGPEFINIVNKPDFIIRYQDETVILLESEWLYQDIHIKDVLSYDSLHLKQPDEFIIINYEDELINDLSDYIIDVIEPNSLNKNKFDDNDKKYRYYHYTTPVQMTSDFTVFEGADVNWSLTDEAGNDILNNIMSSKELNTIVNYFENDRTTPSLDKPNVILSIKFKERYQ